MGKVRTGLVACGAVSVVALTILALLEVGLRLFPALVPLRLLVDFQAELRADIARRRGLPRLDQTVVLDRDDGGPRLRILKPFTAITLQPSGPELSLGAVPTVTMDRAGFCNPRRNDYDLRTIDIITIGVSFTWCTSVKPEDTWTSRLSLLLDRPAYNLGKPETGLYEHVQVVRKFGVQKSPLVVIMNVYEGNDLRDAVHYHVHRGSAGLRAGPCTRLPTSSCRLCSVLQTGLVWRHSYALNLAVTAADHVRYRTARQLAETWTSWGEKESKPRFQYRLVFPGSVARFNPTNTDTDEVVHARCLRKRQISLDVFSEALHAFVELSREHRFVPVVTYTPSAHTAYAANVAFDDPALTDLMPWFSRAQREFFAAKGAELRYVFIDLTGSLQAAAQTGGIDGLLYFPSNLHLTPRGHGVIAEALASVLRN